MPLLLVLFFLIFHPTIRAQNTTDFNQYRTDYLYSRDIYQKNYLDYIAKKQVDLKYGTIATQKEKIEATKLAIVSQNTMLKTYLTALRIYLDQYKTQNPINTEKYQIELQKWEQWLIEQNSIIPSFNNNEDIKNWSTDFKSQYLLIQSDIYAAIIQQAVNQKLQILSKIQTLVSEIQNSHNLTIEGQQWTQNISIKSDLVTDSLQKALGAIPQKSSYLSKSISFYPDSKKEINKANSYLLDMLNDLKTTIIKFNK